MQVKVNAQAHRLWAQYQSWHFLPHVGSKKYKFRNLLLAKYSDCSQKRSAEKKIREIFPFKENKM